MASKEKFLFLEPLRGVFAIVVVVVHGATVGGSSPLLASEKLLQNSTMLVDLFFQLSGFVIAYNYADRVYSMASAAVFQFNRFLRIYPLHLVTFLCFALGFPLMEFAKELLTSNVGGDAAFDHFELSAVLNNLFLTQGIFEKELTYNYPSWSVSVEFYTYATFALVFAVFSSVRLRVLASIVLAVFSANALYMTDSGYPETEMALFRCMYSFYLGVLLYYIYDNFRIKVTSVFVYLSFVVLLVCWFFSHHLSSLVTPFTYSFVFLSLLWSGPSWMKRKLSSPKLVFLGTISYGVYMIHAIVWEGISRILVVFFGYQELINDTQDDMITGIGPVLGTVLLIVGTSLSIFLAYLSYRYLEMPFNNKRIRMPAASKKKSAASAYVKGSSPLR